MNGHFLVSALAILVTLSLPAQSQTVQRQMYGIGNGLGDGSSALFVIDNYQEGPELVYIGETGLRLTDIAVDPARGILYGISITNSSLYRINPLTAEATLIGNTGIPGATALECRGTGPLYAMGSGSPWLYTVDPVTAVATPFIYVGLRPAGDLAFDLEANAIYMSAASGHLVKIDLTTRIVTIQGTFSAGNAAAMYGMTVDPGGNLYTLEGASDNYRVRLYRSSKTTAQLTKIAEFATYGVGASGLTLMPRCAADTNGDCCVDDADLTSVILDFGFAGPWPTASGFTDVTYDRVVDDADITLIILHYGEGCGDEGGGDDE